MPRRRVLIALAVLAALVAAGAVLVPRLISPGFSFIVDEALQSHNDVLPGLDKSPSRSIGSMVGPNGMRDDFAIDEVLLQHTSQESLDAFRARYSGTILRDGMAQPIEGFSPPNFEPSSSGLYLIRVDLTKSSLGDLSSNMTRAGVSGDYKFSSEDAARLVAILARETSAHLDPNIVMRGDATPEHPTTAGGHLDAELWPWMTEDNDPITPGDQGLSVGVAKAWDYIEYKHADSGAPPGDTSETYNPTFVAIVDAGFALDDAGRPIANSDYFYYGDKPLQVDMVDRDGSAGGENRTQCSGGTSCPWHGQGAFGVLGAVPQNQFGSAGTGGPVVVPILVRVDWTWYGALAGMYALADSIRASALLGLGSLRADAISISISGGCYHVCGLTEVAGQEDFHDYMQRTVTTATALGAVVLASAGNEGWNLDDKPITGGGSPWIPCELDNVVCVGAVRANGAAEGYSNYGTRVDIWAPTDILSTANPATAAVDANSTCEGGSNSECDELASFGGTSAATPFAGGVVALMMSLDENSPSPGPSLPPYGTPRTEAVLAALTSVANQVSDAKVRDGYVDAFRSLHEIRANDPPSIIVETPREAQQIGWARVIRGVVAYSDPEVFPEDIYRWAGLVSYTSNIDGLLCETADPPYTCTSTTGALTVGEHVITIRAVDPFGASTSDQVTVSIVNREPTVAIRSPSEDDLIYSDVPAKLSASVFDPDETIADDSVVWQSDVQGPLGLGRSVTATLMTGVHALTVVATDGKGLTTERSIEVRVRSGVGVPAPRIVYPGPDDPCCFSAGEAVTLIGAASDEEDGAVSGASLQWISNIDGALGAGDQLTVRLSGPSVPCEPEIRRHEVQLVATDSDDNSVSVSVPIGIGEVC